MAKGLRSNSRQKSKSKLRTTVFKPVIDARTERLSAKLQDLVSKPQEADMADVQVNIHGMKEMFCFMAH